MTQLLVREPAAAGLVGSRSPNHSRPLVSVLIPGARDVSAIQRCLESVLGQGYTHLEVLAVDDGSAEECRPVLARLAYSDRRLRIVTMPEPVTERHALLAAAKLANGEVFAIVEPDRVLEPDELGRALEALWRAGSASGFVSFVDGGRVAVRRFEPVPVRNRRTPAVREQLAVELGKQLGARAPVGIPGERPRQVGAAFRTALILIGILLFVVLVVTKSGNLGGKHTTLPLLLYTIFVTSFELSRLVAAVFFRRVNRTIYGRANALDVNNSFEPTLSFVIPCMNEEQAIYKTITKCFETDYPPDKVEVIVVNDGSSDATLGALLALQEQCERLTVIDWRVNRGKRHGMAEGFRRATGDIIIQLDSDSYIDPTTVRRLIEPFRNRDIGAVCAHADPENADHNLLTRMQAAYYFMSFRIMKAAESSFLTVFCCSGCSSAYRRDIVMPILEPWLEETFLGRPVTWGDDRALTNRVLKAGYHTIYTDQARAYTICPENLRQLLKQQVRWKKGWFVNSMFAAPFIARKHPFVALTYFFPLIFLTLITPFMAVRAFLYGPIAHGTLPIFYLVGVFIVAALITVYYRLLSRDNRYWGYLLVWSAFNMIVLSFILFYALATIQNRRWGTR